MHIMTVNEVVMGLFLERQDQQIEAEGGVQGLIWVMELQSLVYNTTTRAHGTGRRRKSWLPFSCFCFYVFVLQHAFAFTLIFI